MLPGLQEPEQGGPVKVLQVIDSLALGGAEVLVANMHSGLSARGIECEYYLLRGEQTPLLQKLIGQGANIYSPVGGSVYSPMHIWALQMHLRTFEYDLVHVHLFPAQLWAACAAKLACAPIQLITTEHSTKVRRRTWWYRGIDRWMYRQYRRVASIGPATTANLVAWLPEVRSKIAECPNGVDLDTFALARASGKQSVFSVSEEVPVILCVGRLELPKGHDILLRALRLVPGAMLVLAGDGSLSAQLRALADQLGVSSRVRFLGRRMDVPELLKAADVYVQPSRWEGFGIAALEAMASGMPVVASDVSGLADVIGAAGLLFPVGDATLLAQKLATVLGDTSLRRRLGHAAQERARNFGINKTLDCYETLYRDVVGVGKDVE
jgi:glycosyltransferase involved in cell wall biosynthesis